MAWIRGLTSSSAKLRLATLAALIVFGAVAAFAHTERADADITPIGYNPVCSSNGYWTVSGGVEPPKGLIRCDVAKPGWVFDLSTPDPGDTRWVYEGDRVLTPTCVAAGSLRSSGCEYGSSDYRLIVTEHIGRPRPPVDQPLAHGTQFEGFTYTADDANRAVRGDDGHCYREERIAGQWQRSLSYGTDEDACRQASWQAYHVSVNNRLLVSIPSGRPSGELLRTAAVPPEPEPEFTRTFEIEENGVKTGETFTTVICDIFDGNGNYRGKVWGPSFPCPGGSIVDPEHKILGPPATEEELADINRRICEETGNC